MLRAAMISWMRRLAPKLLGVLCCAWVVLLVTAPTSALGGVAATVTYAFASLVCHQIPERSFYMAGSQWPVCARCAGIYAGVALGAVAWAWVGWRDQVIARVRPALFGAAALVLVTWVPEAIGLWSTSNDLRASAALPLGMVIATVVQGAVSGRLQ